MYKAALDDNKAAAGKKDAPTASLPGAAPQLATSDTAKLYKELRELFGAEFDAALKEKEKEKDK